MNELGYYEAAFHHLVGDADELQGGDAVGFFHKSGLSTEALRDIWDCSDKRGSGSLNVEEFVLAMKLIKVAQDGQEPNEENANKAMGLCSLDDWDWDDYKPAKSSSSTTSASGDWDVTVEEKKKFDGVFDRLELEDDGSLSGDVARDVLLHSGLPAPVLGNIWECADMDKDGRLDRDEFAVAMHLVYKCLAGDSVPSTIPKSLVPPSKRPGYSAPKDNVDEETRTGLPGMTKANKTKWVVTSKGRKTYDKFFQGADKDKDGLVSGDDVKSIFITSKLPKAELAHLWNLVDIFDTGTLNSELFYLAMYLVSERVQGTKLPDTLSENMIPPSCRDASLTSPPVVTADAQSSKKAHTKSKKKKHTQPAQKEESAEITPTSSASDAKKVQEEVMESMPSETTVAQEESPKSSSPPVVIAATEDADASKEADTAAVESALDDELKHLNQSLKAQQLTNSQLQTKVDQSNEIISEKQHEIQEIKKKLEAMRIEEKSLRQLLKNGKSQVKQLIQELKSATASANKVERTNDQLRDSNRRVSAALRDYSDAPNALRQHRGASFGPRDNGMGKQQQPQMQGRHRGGGSRRQQQRPTSMIADPFAVHSNDPFSVSNANPWKK